MVKHILGQAIFQSIVILTVLFAGTMFIQEEYCFTGSEYAAPEGVDNCDSATRELFTFKEIAERL
jgi:hypothetical protein